MSTVELEPAVAACLAASVASVGSWNRQTCVEQVIAAC